MKKLFFCFILCICLLNINVVGAASLTAVTEVWPPYMGPDLKERGVVPELATEIFKRVGYDINLKFLPWPRAMMLVKRGNADLLLGAFYTDVRADVLAFPDSVMVEPNVLFAKKIRGIKFCKLDDLKDYSIGVQSGAFYSDTFEKAGFLKKDAATARIAGIKKLLADRVDLFAGPKNVVLYEIKQYFPKKADQIEILSPSLSDGKIYICVSKKCPDYQTIVDQFNEKLAEMKNDGSYDAIMKKHGF